MFRSFHCVMLRYLEDRRDIGCIINIYITNS